MWFVCRPFLRGKIIFSKSNFFKIRPDILQCQILLYEDIARLSVVSHTHTRAHTRAHALRECVTGSVRSRWVGGVTPVRPRCDPGVTPGLGALLCSTRPPNVHHRRCASAAAVVPPPRPAGGTLGTTCSRYSVVCCFQPSLSLYLNVCFTAIDSSFD